MGGCAFSNMTLVRFPSNDGNIISVQLQKYVIGVSLNLPRHKPGNPILLTTNRAPNAPQIVNSSDTHTTQVSR